MKNVISIDIGRNSDGTNKMCAIVLFDGTIESMVTAPSDYSAEDFLNCIISECSNCDSTEIIFDKNGMGRAFEDYFIENGVENVFGLGIDDAKMLPFTLSKAKDNLIELAINSHFEGLTKIEFKKMIKELENLEIVDRAGRLIFNRLNESIGKSRAICYLQYFYKYVAL
jgi:hypothetical protein